MAESIVYNAAMPSLTPEISDEVKVIVSYVGGQPHITLQMRRLVNVKGGIALNEPEVQPLSETSAIMILCQTVQSAAVTALTTLENQKTLLVPGGNG